MEWLQRIWSRIRVWFGNLIRQIRGIRVSPDVAIDLGTATVLVYVQGKGIVLTEPSVVAVETDTGRIRYIGKNAQPMLDKPPRDLTAIRPLREGVIEQYGVTSKMIQYFIRRACGSMFFPPRVMICVPTGITEVEERAVLDAAREAGARRTYLIEEPKAAAIGAGLDISGPDGRMVVDIGGGTTDIAVLCLGDVVTSGSIRVAGDKMDEAIKSYVRRRYDVLIGDQTAERIKQQIGCVIRPAERRTMEVRGNSTREHIPKQIILSSDEMIEALTEPVTAIITEIANVIERTPPELIGDILKNGIVMTGGGSLLTGLDELVTRFTGVRAHVAPDAVCCVVLGTGKMLDRLDTMTDGAINLSGMRKLRE